MKRLAASLSLASAAFAAGAAGFDCTRAASTVERTICADPALSAQDDRLTALFNERKAHDKSVVTAQRAWLHDVRDKCTTADCLATAYAARLQALSAPAAAACKVPEKTLLGTWTNVNPAGGDFEEVYFAPTTESPNFVSWVRHAPFVTGSWSLQDCKVHVAGSGENTDFTFSVEALADGKLKLKDEADADDVLLLKKSKSSK
ncbi:MAG TPA: lysozyme inhibitor LprI family protein [Burkholderiaceae bacterium]